MRRRMPGGSSCDRGAAAVEFALILPVLAALVFGIINYGDILSARQAVSQAAAEGARAGAVSQQTTEVAKIADARAAVDAALQSQGVSCSGCDIKIGTSYRPPGSDPAAPAKECGSGAECVWVTVVVDHDALVPGFTFGFGGKLRYTASARVS
ncbi:TadE/TadG family type IV pilus assembly protein [Nocardioides sp. L-11A]|uniref:TadE/TadG family type IV pilus assembly protein n=1 Tax=Nocardioides sp. L-11A TaxID=3043848 RepID=UPI00249AABDD|nr:pilus assembly protein [Nocardioides sp. L-11A]